MSMLWIKKIEIHDHRQQNIRDLPYRDKQVILKIDIRRFKCRECGKDSQKTSHLYQNIAK